MSDTAPYQNYLAARAEYLGASGWLPMAPVNPGDPVLWRHPTNSKYDLTDRAASTIQELRDEE